MALVEDGEDAWRKHLSNIVIIIIIVSLQLIQYHPRLCGVLSPGSQRE